MISLLLDVSTMRILVASDESGSINLLHSVDGNTLNPVLADRYKVVGAEGVPNLKQLTKAPPETWLDYFLEGKQQRISYDRDKPEITDHLRKTAALYQRKFQVLSAISGAINASRRKLVLPAAYEDTVRRIKKDQAMLFRASGYDLAKMNECIFIWQYAEVHGISPKEAADRLILEAEFFEAEIWKSEGIKMKYWNRVLETKDVESLGELHEDFKREFWVNALV